MEKEKEKEKESSKAKTPRSKNKGVSSVRPLFLSPRSYSRLSLTIRCACRRRPLVPRRPLRGRKAPHLPILLLMRANRLHFLFPPLSYFRISEEPLPAGASPARSEPAAPAAATAAAATTSNGSTASSVPKLDVTPAKVAAASPQTVSPLLNVRVLFFSGAPISSFAAVLY